ncbi:MAG: energy transducer TonB [Acidobacteriia bacterium]|nr:energy transducer TonB [Terriglobia bacterium]
MTKRMNAVLFFVATACIAMAAQNDEPLLTTVNIPKYPPLARAARVEGVVKLAFTLPANAGKPTNVEVLSGHPMLKGPAADNVKTWILENRYAVDRRYEATFRYRISEVEVPAPTRDRVTFDSFHDVEVVTDLVKGTIQYECSDGPCPEQ